MKKVLYVLNDCMRKFSYERTEGLSRAFRAMEEPVDLYVVRSDGYSEFAPEHNCGEYNIFRLPDYSEFDGILLDINSVFTTDNDAYASRGTLYAAEAAAASGRPVISMANDMEGFYYVGIDNYSAMQTVIRHLHREMGLTDFWFVMGPADNYENLERTRGLRDYCKENGLPCGEDRFYAESFIIECGIHAFRALFDRHGGALPQAVICANDHIALGICHAAEKAGYQVPRDFLLTGFDNTDVSSYLSPSITTVDQVSWSLGDACADVLRRIWQGERVPRRVCTPTQLILRESTGHASDQQDLKKQIMEYIGRNSSSTDFSYRLSAMQYQLPGCRSVEEMGRALVQCLSTLKCGGVSLVLDSSLFENSSALPFDDSARQTKDAAGDLPIEGYSDSMELVFQWEAGKEPRTVRKRVGRTLRVRGQGEQGENYLFTPIHFKEYTVGCLVFHDCLDLIRIKGVSSVVNTLTMALRNYFAGRRLKYMNLLLSGISRKDALTGLYNRLGYHDLAYPLFRELSRRGGRLGILFLDMDHLKQVNDTFGHAAGDAAIRSISNAILHSIPADAIPVRYGGDEFLVLLPCAQEQRLREILDAVSADLPLEAERLGAPDMLDISAGCVLSDPEEAKTLDQYVELADSLMYAEKNAKRAGEKVRA